MTAGGSPNIVHARLQMPLDLRPMCPKDPCGNQQDARHYRDKKAAGDRISRSVLHSSSPSAFTRRRLKTYCGAAELSSAAAPRI